MVRRRDIHVRVGQQLHRDIPREHILPGRVAEDLPTEGVHSPAQGVRVPRVDERRDSSG